MSRRFFDAVTASNIPVTAQMVGGYVDGLYKWSDTDWVRFPGAVKVRIAVFSTTNDGHVLDCEPGNCTPAQAVDWVLMRRRAGADPSVYCNQLDPQTGWPAVRAAFRARGVREPYYWVARYDGVAVVPAGAIAKQYIDDETLGYDLSVVADHWPGIDPAPTPAPPPPAAKKEDDIMLVIRSIKGSAEIWGQIGARYWHIASPADLNTYTAACKEAGVPVVCLEVSAAEHANLLSAGAAG